MARIVVVGTGYVGLVTGACLAANGHQVVCHDIDADRIRHLCAGQIPIHEPGLDEVVAAALTKGALSFTTDLDAACRDAGYALLAVGTPPMADGSSDLRALHVAADSLVGPLPAGAVAIVRSTVPPGTGDGLARRFTEAGRDDVQVVNAPEFLAEGTAVADFLEPDRLVFGGPEPARSAVAALWSFAPTNVDRFLTDRPTAELSKYAANTFLAARVSLINEMARLCDATGSDVTTLARIVGADDRIGPHFLRPGIGYGGSCFPKDVQATASVARQHGVEAPVVRAVEETNEQQWRRTADRILELLDGTKPRRVAILGIAFKPGTDDTRHAPSVRIAIHLQKLGVQVRMHDPVAHLPKAARTAGVEACPTAGEAVAGADMVLLATEWKEYTSLDWKALAATTRRPLVLDGRNALPWPALVTAGWTVHGVGARP